jgi:hypothetical protein
MKQILNIFIKDFRHHWREVAASLALMVAFAWLEVRGWTGEYGVGIDISTVLIDRYLTGLVTALLPISWAFLIVRVVQGDSLVGDRQFWVTRPYDWKKLLSAKAVFVLASINFPLLLLDVFLLVKAGFRPTSYLAGLLWMQVLMILYFFLSAIALSTVTATLAQILLAVLLIALYMIGMVGLTQLIPYSNFSDRGDWLSAVLLIGTALAVILLQYTRRQTARARWLVAACGAAITFIALVTPYRTEMAREYPLSTPGQFHLALLPAKAFDSGEFIYAADGKVALRFPLSITGIPDESFVQLNGTTLTLENADGLRWDSGWEFAGQKLFPDQKVTSLDLRIKKSVFDRMKASPIKARLLVAFTLFHDRNQRQFVTPAGEFAMPGVGLCSAKTEYWHRIHCRVPMKSPEFLLISSENTSSTCPRSDRVSPDKPEEMAHGSVGGDDSEPAELGISPVKSVDLYLDGASRGICPGTPLVLSNPIMVSHNRIELQLDNLSLDNYRLGPEKFNLSNLVLKPQ